MPKQPTYRLWASSKGGNQPPTQNRTPRRRERRALEQMQSHLLDKEPSIKVQDILETIADGCCVVDHESRIVYVNLRACEMGRGTPETFIGQVWWKVLAQITDPDAERFLRGAVETGSRGEYEIFSPDTPPSLWVRVCPMSGGLTAYTGGIFQNERGTRQRSARAKRRFGGFLTRARSEWLCGSGWTFSRCEPGAVQNARLRSGGSDLSLLPRHCPSR